jgi:hypothetical protein
LVDTFITVEQNRELAEWVEKSAKNLIAIYATHGHGDREGMPRVPRYS